MQKTKVTKISGASGLVLVAVYITDNAAKLVSITRIAHRREVYE
jgi:hypothetical protein